MRKDIVIGRLSLSKILDLFPFLLLLTYRILVVQVTSIQEYKPGFHDSIGIQYNPSPDQNLDPVARLVLLHKTVVVRRSHNKYPNTSDTLLW